MSESLQLVVTWPACRLQLVHESLQTIKARYRSEDWAACDTAKALAVLRQQATQPPSSNQQSSPHATRCQAPAVAARWQPRQAAFVQGRLPQQCTAFPKAAAAASVSPRQTKRVNVKNSVAAGIPGLSVPKFVELLSHGSMQVQVEAAGLLGALANGSKQHKATISQAGGVQALLRLSEEGSSTAARASALAALNRLCCGCPGHQAEVEKITLSLLGNLRSHHGILQEESANLLQQMCAGSGERQAALQKNLDVVEALLHLLESQSNSRAATPAAAAAVRCLRTLAQDKQFRARLCQPPGNIINSLANLLGDDLLPEIQADSSELLWRLSSDSRPRRVAIAAAARPALERLRQSHVVAGKLLDTLPSSPLAAAAAAQT